ncbi:MAG TPA: ABC transporter permease [Clostridiaceae bacterium]|nr:ABC transporter permease [Clostridiaceae bacterium]
MSPEALLNIGVSAISQGIIWSIMSLGVYITYRLLNFADLTVDASFTTGGAVSAIMITQGYDPILSLVCALLAGMGTGFITGFLNTRMNISALLSSILAQIGLYSINLRIMGKPNLPLLRVETTFKNFSEWIGLRDPFSSLILGFTVAVAVVCILYWFFGTEIGCAIRATGDNPSMVRALGVNTKNTILLGLIIANGLVALSGGLLAQSQGFADMGMGTGAIVIGLATIIIGEVLFFKKNFMLRLFGIVFGSIVYRIIIAIVLQMKVPSQDLKLFTAIIVALALWIPNALDQSRARRSRKAANKELFGNGDQSHKNGGATHA